MDERQTPNMSFRSARNASRLSPLHVHPERSPLHDVRQRAHANDAWTRRIACADWFSRTSKLKGRLLPLVEPDVIEPTTSCLESRRPPNCAMAPHCGTSEAGMVGLRRFELP